MYEQVFNLTSRPFTSIHYVKHYFPAAEIDQSLQQTKMLVERGSGPVVVVGDHGTGKTLFLAILEKGFESQFRIVNISASLLRNREDLLQNILFQLQMNCRGLKENEMRLDLIEMLKGDQSRGILLMVDDAQKLTAETVEEMQLLTDFIHDGEPCVRLVLAGSQGLEERLTDTRLASFNQRIAGRFFLSNLNNTEVEQYVRAHLERSGGQPDELFAPDSFKAICEVSEGRPRYINQVCDHAMIFAATRGIVPVTDSLVREAWYDIQKLPGSVAPAGSGAAMSDSSVSVQSVETDSEGWTVLEFGELSDSEEDSITDVEDQKSESSAAPEETVEVIEQPVAAEEEEEVAESEAVQEPDPVPESGVAVDSSDEAKPTLISSEDVEQEAATVGVPTALGGAAILASAMAGFGVVAGGEPESSPEVEASVESEAEAEQVSETTEVEESVTYSEDSGTEPETSSAVEVAEAAVEDPQVDEQPETSPSTPVFEDPFAADDYENEEVLTDAYSPFVAQQNQRSLEVTSEQLQNLTPGKTVQWNESSDQEADSDPVEAESFPTFETAMQPPEPVREAQTPPRDPRETADTRLEMGVLGPNSTSEEFVVSRDAAVLSDERSSIEQDVRSVDLEPVEANPGSGFVPIDPDANLELDTPDVPNLADSETLHSPEDAQSEPVAAQSEPVAVESVTEEDQSVPVAVESEPEDVQPDPVAIQPDPVADFSEPAAAPAAETDSNSIAEPNPQFHEQASSPNDPAIRQQAEEIIRSLEQNPGATQIEVSHETPTGPLTIQEETNVIEASIQRSIESQQAPVSDAVAASSSPVVMPNLDEIKNALRQAQDRLPSTGAGQAPTTTGKIPVQISGVDPVQAEQEILNEVEDQASFLAGLVAPQDTNQASSSQPVAGQDDRAILEVNQDESATEKVAAAASEEAPMPSWSQQEPSQGEAARVDYQRLFDQLRNVQGNQE